MKAKKYLRTIKMVSLVWALMAVMLPVVGAYGQPTPTPPPSEPQTTVMWYGAGCKDEYGTHLENGYLIQLIRSQGGVIGAPDQVTGEPTGDNLVADTTTYQYPTDAFQADDWSEKESYYVYVRIWNADTTATGTYYWDSAVRQATGVLPIDIDCSGAETDKAKGGVEPTVTPTPTATPTLVMSLGASSASVGTGDVLTMELTIRERIAGSGNVVLYVVVQTPVGAWMSFVPQGGGIVIKNGLLPALTAPAIPVIDRTILDTTITDSLASGDYRFIAAVFNVGDPITLANWRSMALYYAETIVSVR
ncbi:MAG: hypothetical protein P8123_05545 [bacterium]